MILIVLKCVQDTLTFPVSRPNARSDLMTDYCDPRTVTGPKHHISNVQVIYDGGPDDFAEVVLRHA